MNLRIHKKSYVKLLLLVAVCLIPCGPLMAQSKPAPNEVIVCEHVDYIGTCKSFKILPSMRHKLVPSLGSMNDKISSVLVGSDVKVVLFEHTNFRGRPWHRSKSDPRLEDFNDITSSLIISPKNKLEEFVCLSSKSRQIGCFPLPESMTEHESKYPSFDSYVNDKAEELYLSPNLEVTLCEHVNFKGKCLEFPGQASPMNPYILKSYQFNKKASSIIVRTRGWKPTPASPDIVPGGTGVKQAPPVTGVKQAPPVTGVKQAPPVTGVKQAPPVTGVKQAPPVTGKTVSPGEKACPDLDAPGCPGYKPPPDLDAPGGPGYKPPPSDTDSPAAPSGSTK